MPSETGRAVTACDPGSEDNFLTDVNVMNVVADFHHFTGDVAARNVRKRNGIVRKPVADPKVQMVQRTRVHADQNFVWMNMRLVDIRVVQHTWITMLVKDNGFHRRPPGEGTVERDDRPTCPARACWRCLTG